jgi:hypothetical protein
VIKSESRAKLIRVTQRTYDELSQLLASDPAHFGTDFDDALSEVMLFVEGYHHVVLP